MNQYIEAVLRRLKHKNPNEVIKTIIICYENGFTEDDAFKYIQCTQNDNEFIAFSQMGIIAAKYAKNAGHWAGFSRHQTKGDH